MFKKSDRLYFPGCVAYFKYNENFELYKRIFARLGIGFNVIEKKVCCGLPAFEAGYEGEARKLARRNFEIFKEEGIISIITSSPCCYKMFLQDYQELLPDWNIEVENVWDLIVEKLKNKPGLIKNKPMMLIGFHDSCYLSRYTKTIGSIREILALIGYEVKEIDDSKSNSVCCGSCGGLPRVDPDLANNVAKQRLLQFKRQGINKIIVCSLDAYKILKDNSRDMDIEILELSDILADSLGIKKRKVDRVEEERVEKEDQVLIDAEANMEIEEELKDEDYEGEVRDYE